MEKKIMELEKRIEAMEIVMKLRAIPPAHRFNLKEFCEKNNFDYEAIISKSRKSELVKMRNCLAYLIRKKYHITYPELGRMFNRDHSTMINSCDVVDSMIAIRDFEFMDLLNKLTEIV